MTNPKDEIARVLEAAEKAAYARGWAAACESMMKAAAEVKDHFFSKPTQPELFEGTNATIIEPRRTGRPASAAIAVVQDCINASPGKKGVEVVKAVQLVDPAIPERTVRTNLRRLKIQKQIWQRDGRWYPKRDRSLLENDDGEANSSPPHH